PPHGATNQSERLKALTDQLEILNSNICNGRRDQAEILVADAVAKNPPRAGDDVAIYYLAHLATNIRYIVLGGIYGQKLNAGASPDRARVKLAAANDFKAAYFAPSVRVDNGGKVLATSDVPRGDLQKLIEKTTPLNLNTVINFRELSDAIALSRRDVLDAVNEFIV